MSGAHRKGKQPYVMQENIVRLTMCVDLGISLGSVQG